MTVLKSSDSGVILAKRLPSFGKNYLFFAGKIEIAINACLEFGHADVHFESLSHAGNPVGNPWEIR